MNFRGVMGRLQRKKDSAAKAKKRKNGRILSSTTPVVGNNINPVVSTISSQNKGRKEHVVATAIKDKHTTKQNFFSKTFSFIRESKLELKKVVWPSKKQTLGSTFAVIIVVCMISLFLGIVDAGLSSMIRSILG